MNALHSIRPPAVAGSFYPVAMPRLKSMVSGFLSATPPPATYPAIRAVIAPHAGYVYSGALCGRVYAAVSEVPARVWLIGPSHHFPLRETVGTSWQSFATPLGESPVDGETGGWRADDRAHAPEHALETHLPFLQHRWGAVPIVPLLTACQDVPALATHLQERLQAHDLLAVSSDLSHFYTDTEARAIDAATARAIENLDADRVDAEGACGWVAIRTLLRIARARGWTPCRIGLTNSAPVSGDRERVVGYGGWIFQEPSP